MSQTPIADALIAKFEARDKFLQDTCTEARARLVKLTKAQRAQVKALMEDSGFTRAEAVAWVLANGGTY